MNEHPLISCIIPVYNASAYLKRCLESVLRQDYRPIELILVDDGSNDGSDTLCDEYQRAYPFVTAIHTPNRGASLARKLGIEQAKGDYLLFVDSDDYLAPDAIATLYALLTKYRVALCAGKISKVNVGQPVEAVTDARERLLSLDEIMPRFFNYEFWGMMGKLYRKEVFDSLYFPTATLSEDYVLMAQLFVREQQMAYTDRPVYRYEAHDNSLSHTKLSKRSFEEFDNVRYVYRYIGAHCPRYRQHALSKAVETAVKLLTMIQGAATQAYRTEQRELTRFLRAHARRIACNANLSVKVRCLALGYCLSKSFTYQIYARIHG